MLKEETENALDDLRDSFDLVAGRNGVQLHLRRVYSLAASHSACDVDNQSNQRSPDSRVIEKAIATTTVNSAVWNPKVGCERPPWGSFVCASFVVEQSPLE